MQNSEGIVYPRALPRMNPSPPRFPLSQDPSYVVHLPRRLLLFLLVVVDASHRGQLVVVLALGARFVGRILAGVPLNVFCTDGTPLALWLRIGLGLACLRWNAFWKRRMMI